MVDLMAGLRALLQQADAECDAIAGQSARAPPIEPTPVVSQARR